MKKRGHWSRAGSLMWKKKTLLIMKLTVFLIFFFQFSLMAAGFSQSKVSLELNEASMEEFIALLGKQTGRQFLYDSGLLGERKTINVKAHNEEYTSVLGRVLGDMKLTYEVVNDVVVIKALPRQQEQVKKRVIIGKVTDTAGEPLPGVTVRVVGTTLGVSTNGIGSFSVEVPATVGALMVSFVGMKTQMVELVEGKMEYTIKLEEDQRQLEEVNVVSTGYQDIDRRKLTSAVTTLKMDDIKVDGLSSVDKMLEGHIPGMIFMQNSGQAGAAPKVRIRGTSTVLGSQEPLWVVDGVVQHDPVNVDPAQLNDLDFVNLLGNAISGLNPDDIEQIDVLKDAAATAIYGVRAANGVIVITTKKGKAGPPSVTYSLTGTINRRPHYTDKSMYLMNSRERIGVSREMFERGMEFQEITNWVGYEKSYLDYKAGRISFAEFNNMTNYYESVNTDWFDILCENSFSNKHTLSLSGGSQNLRYYASIGYNDERGVIKKELNRSYTASLKLNGTFERMSFQFGLQGSNNKRRYTPQSGGTNIIQYAYDMNRAIPAYNPDGSRWFYMRGNSAKDSYLFNMENEMEKTYQEQNGYSVTLNANVKYNILRDLNIEGTMSYTMGSTMQETTFEEGSWYIAKLKKNGPGDNTSECPLGGEYQVNDTRNNSYMARLQLNYNHLFGEKHSVNVSLGGEVSSTKYNSLREIHRGYYPGRGKSFATITEIELAKPEYRGYRVWLAGNKPVIGEQLTNLASAYFTATYSYNSRYTFNFNTRMDGSNQFGSRSNEKLLPVWSVSGRWDMAQEFFKHSKAVNTLALKLSYGHQGNMLDNQTSRMIIEKGAYNKWFDDFTSTVKYFPNPDLNWEMTSSYNAEITFSLLNNKIGGTVGYYYKHTQDAFLTKKVSEINGVPNYVVNKGELSNQGVEVTLNFVPINRQVDASGKQGFVWRFDPQIGQVVNKLVNRAINDRSNTLRDKVTYQDYLSGNVELVGKPLNTFYSYRFKGLDSRDGHPTFYGTEEERKDELNQRYLGMTEEEVWVEVMAESGTRVPVIQGGLSNYFGYRQFGLSFNFTYSLGNKIRLLKLGGNKNIRPYPEQNMRREFVNRWQRPGDEERTNIPGLIVSNSINQPWWGQSPYFNNPNKFAGNSVYDMYDNSDLRVVSGNYLKLQSLSFRYNVHNKICKQLHLKSAYMSLSATNLFTIASKALKGQDVTQSGAAPSVNLSVRPNYSFTLNVTF